VTEPELEELLSRPTEADLAFARELRGDVLVLGAGGKMGPSLVERIRRAGATVGNTSRVIAITRRECPDLLAPGALEALPDCENVIYMAARKFGSSGAPHETWAANALLPALAARRYKNSRIVAFSTGNVYPFVDVTSKGATEATPAAPVGEYAWSALARERMFEMASHAYGTRVALLRLNYAVDLRYGVLHDLGVKVMTGAAVDLTMGHVNVIWQGDANSAAFRALGLCASPPCVLNLTGSAVLRVRWLCEELGRRMRREPVFTGMEAESALLSDASKCAGLLGEPETGVERMLDWTAEWLLAGGRSLGKPTKFEVRDGRF
jgi:nucleoside-diphosphate-sugar epimerase